MSGYNRDLQLIKKPLIDSLNIAQASLEVVREFIQGMEIDKNAVEKTIKKDIFAADIANEMVEKDGISFRDAYIKVGQALDEVKDFNLEENIKSKKSLGSPGNLDLEYYKKILKEL